ARKIPGNKAVRITANTASFWSAYASVMSAVTSVARVAASIKFADGGYVGRRYADGGAVRGPGTSRSDSIPAWLSNGEYVMPADSVRKYGLEFMDAVRNKELVPARSIMGPDYGAPSRWDKGRE